MSEWYEAENFDITIDRNEKQVDIYVTNNDCGNVYVSLSFEQIINLAKRLAPNEE